MGSFKLQTHEELSNTFNEPDWHFTYLTSWSIKKESQSEPSHFLTRGFIFSFPEIKLRRIVKVPPAKSATT